MTSLTHKGLERKETYSVEAVLSKYVPPHKRNGQSDKFVLFDGDKIRMTSHRYFTFKMKGVKCVECGIEGQFFAKERSPGNESYHFNLYAINDSGDEVLMTKDHIIPKAVGGKNVLANYQTMCKVCNEKKADTYAGEHQQ